MEELVECIVPRKLTSKAFFGRCAILGGDILVLFLSVLLTFAVPPIFAIVLILIVIMVFCTYFVFRNTNVEYEYDFFGGDMRIDKIMNRSVRKKITTYSFSKMEFMAPADSNRFYNQRQDQKIVDYSSHDDADKSYIAVIYDDKNKAIRLKFTPNEELLTLLKKLYPRKVYED